ncbi:MAG: hypothetical protein M1820_001645 [Bogoriella megaspora]|nr:MAG: hypothetical protein M1820_001645 [Bogoriella megaspora]
MSYWPVPANQSYMQGAAPMPAGAVYMTAQGQQLYTQGAGPLYTGPVVMNGFPAPAAANMPTNAPPSGPYPPFSHPSGHGVMSTVHPTTTLNHQHNHYAPSQQAYGHPMASAMAPPAAPAIAIPEGLQMAPHTFHYWQLCNVNILHFIETS